MLNTKIWIVNKKARYLLEASVVQVEGEKEKGE